MMFETISQEQALAIILYCAEEKEWKQIAKYSGNFSFEDRDELLAKFDGESLSQAQRLLLAAYIHLHGAMKSKNLLEDQRLSDVRKALEVSEEFAGFIFHGMKRLNADLVLAGRTPIESIIEPTNATAVWAANTVYQASRDGGYSKKTLVQGLVPQEYEHPLDKMALDALEGTPGLEAATKAFWKYGWEKILRVQYTGSNIQIKETNFPQIHRALVSVCDTLNMSPLPELYVENGFVNASATGVDNPILMLTSGAIGLLSYDELLFLIGHEVGHIKSQHILYHEMAKIIPFLGDMIGSMTLGIGGAVATGLQIALLNWQRKSEFTADRAGLLACQDVEAATRTMMKLAGAPPRFYRMLKAEDFQKQAKEFEQIDFDKLGKLAKYLSVAFATHPWTVMRGHELYKWIDTREYEKVLHRHTAKSHTTGSKHCHNCGIPCEAAERFCTECGTTL
ncbi:MAG: M48 family metalloprotease [Proteobacteria bacterium]|nr:M48 family metalloprotease [Pseudomonadota bacterium]